MGIRDNFLRLGESMKKAFAEREYLQAEQLAESVFAIGFMHVGSTKAGVGWFVADRESPSWIPFRGGREECIAFWHGYQHSDAHENLVVCVESENPVIVWPDELFGEPLEKSKGGSDGAA